MSTNILRARGRLQFRKAAIPTGYGPGTAIMLPIKSGELGAVRIDGLGTVTAAALSAMIASLNAIAGTSTVTGNANAIGLITIAGTSAGVATVTANTLVAASMSGAIAGVATILANLGAVIPCAATSAGVASSSVNLKGTGRLGGTISIGASGYLSNDDVERLAEAVAGTAIETGYDLQQALRLILSAVAGKVSGAATTTVTFRNVTDDKNRIVATVDSDGNRSSITYNVSD